MAEQTSRAASEEDVNSELVCECGGRLDEMDAKNCYGGTGVACDDCSCILGNSTRVFHCLREKNHQHPGGFDLCATCYQRRLSTQNQGIFFYCPQFWSVSSRSQCPLTATTTTHQHSNIRLTLFLFQPPTHKTVDVNLHKKLNMNQTTLESTFECGKLFPPHVLQNTQKRKIPTHTLSCWNSFWN